MDITNEDTYFLDRDLAYQTALAHNTFRLDTGEVLEQICYYDGQAFEHAPDNLINVSAEKFAEYFQSHMRRIPTKVEPLLSDFTENPQTAHKRLSIILNAVQHLCKNNYTNKDAA